MDNGVSVHNSNVILWTMNGLQTKSDPMKIEMYSISGVNYN